MVENQYNFDYTKFQKKNRYLENQININTRLGCAFYMYLNPKTGKQEYYGVR